MFSETTEVFQRTDKATGKNLYCVKKDDEHDVEFEHCEWERILSAIRTLAEKMREVQLKGDSFKCHSEEGV